MRFQISSTHSDRLMRFRKFFDAFSPIVHAKTRRKTLLKAREAFENGESGVFWKRSALSVERWKRRLLKKVALFCVFSFYQRFRAFLCANVSKIVWRYWSNCSVIELHRARSNLLEWFRSIRGLDIRTQKKQTNFVGVWLVRKSNQMELNRTQLKNLKFALNICLM